MPAMSTSQILIMFIVIVLVYGVYTVYTLKDKIHCTFIGEDKTTFTKFAKMKSNRIEWRGGWYNLDITRTTLKLVWVGVIPTWVRCLIYKFDSNKPLDPTTWNNGYDRPEDRKALNRSEAIQSLMAKQNTVLSVKGGKKGMLEGMMPVLMIAGFLIVGYIVYTLMGKIDLLGTQNNIIQQQMLDIMHALGK